MATLRQTIGKLEGIRGRLLKPRGFYLENVDNWRVLAQKTATDLLLNARPLNCDPDQWVRRVRVTVARISGALVSRAFVGAVIRMATREDAVDAEDPFNAEFGFGVEDIERWVVAGMEKESPDEPGKNIDGRDAGKTAREIAWTVMAAIKNGRNASGLTKHIEQFLKTEGEDVAAGLYPDILAAWLEVIGVRAVQDWRAWVKAQIA